MPVLLSAADSVSAVRQPRSAGRPLSVASGRAILRAATELLQEAGFGGLSIEQVARRAGVTRQTIYRRWANKVQLVEAVLATLNNEDAPLPDTGSVVADLVALAGRYAVQQLPGPPFVHSLVVQAQYDPDLAAVVDAYVSRRRAHALAVIRRGVSRGELAADVDPDLLADLFYGFAWYRRLVTRTVIVQHEHQQVVDTLLRGFLVTPHPASGDR